MRRTIALFVAVTAASAYAAWPRPASSHETLTTTVLFDREIVRILDSRCVMCHAAAGPSFPLETYEQTWLRRRETRARVIARHMPPWAPVAGYGAFANDNSLTLRETQFITSWVEGLGPRSAGTVFTNTVDAGARAPEVRAGMAHAGHWHLGEPDLARPLPPMRVDARQPASVRRVVVDPGLKSARRVRAVEFMPGDRRVVRAAFFSVEQTGQWIGAWTPWYGYLSLPGGAAFVLPAGARIVVEMHYRGAGEAVVDSGTLGLFFSDDAASRRVSDVVLQAVPGPAAKTALRRLRAETRIAADAYAVALRPEMSGSITSLEVSARTPEGATEILLFARDFDHAWPTPYIMKTPVLLRRGTVLSVTAYATPAVPNPAVRLTVSTYAR